MKRLSLLLSAAAFFTFMLPVSVALGQASDPLSVVRAYLEALNAGNAEAAVATWADDAVFTTPVGTSRGKEQIRAFIANNVALHQRIEASNIQVAGDKVTYSQRTADDRLKGLGIEFTTGTTEAVVQGGKIKSLTIALSPESAARLQAAQQQQTTPAPPSTLPKSGGAAESSVALYAALGLSLAAFGSALLLRRYRR